MLVTCERRPLSPRIRTGPNAAVEDHYIIVGTPGTSDEELKYSDALAALANESPLTFDLYENGVSVLPRSDLTCEPTEDLFVYEGVASYSIDNSTEPVYSFETAGGTHHIEHGLVTPTVYGETPTVMPGGINDSGDGNGPSGIDIAVPVFSFSYAAFFNPAQITRSYELTLYVLTGCVNNATWKGYAAGEVLFLGAQGQCRGIGPFEIGYKFGASPNADDMTIGTISGIDKGGWQYVWARYGSAGPKSVFVETVHPSADFTLLGLGV